MDYSETFYINRYKKLCYFPIRKNASTTYAEFFAKHRWEPAEGITEDLYDYVWFAHIQDPKTRYIKGIAQVLDDADLYPSIHQSPLNQYVIRIYHDPHVNAVSEQFGEKAQNINFLILDENSLQTTYDFLMQYDLEYPDLLTFENLNVSRRRRTLLQERVQTVLEQDSDLGRVYDDYIADTYNNDVELWKLAQQNHQHWPYVITYAEFLKDRNTEVRIITEVKQNQEFNVWEAYGELLENRKDTQEEIMDKPLWDRVKHAWKVMKG